MVSQIASIAFLVLLTSLSLILALNYRDAAYRSFELISTVMFGWVGSASPRTVRQVGAVIAFLGMIGVITEIFVMLSD